MRKAYTKGTIQSTLIMEMPQKSEQKNWKTLTCWLEDFLASLSVLLTQVDKDSMTQEELSFLKSQGFSKTKDPNIFFLKMYGIYYITIRGELSRQSLGFSPKWGMMFNGRYITVATMESVRTEKEYSLLDFIEVNGVEEKYYYSQETTKKRLMGN